MQRKRSSEPHTIAWPLVVVGLLAGVLCVSTAAADEGRAAVATPPKRRLDDVSHERVKLSGGFWGRRLKTHRAATIPHALDCLEKDGHVTNFDKAAGLLQGPPSGRAAFDSDLYEALEGAMYCVQPASDGLLRKPAEHAKNRERAASAYEANLKKYKDDNNVLVLPGLVADKKNQRVEVLVESTGLGREAPCEFTIVDETSEHGYESLLMSLAKPSAIHRALKFIGKQPGEPFDPASLRFWAKGETFVLSLVKDKERPVRLEKLLVDRRTGKSLPEQGFLFTGSRMVPDRDDPKKQVYAADYYQPKAIVSLFNSTYSVLEVPYRAAKSEVYQNTVVNPDHAFAAGAVLTLVIEPADKEHARRVKNLVLHVRPGNAATDKPATGVERLNRLRLQLKDAATVLNAKQTLRSFVEALAALDKKEENFLAVTFDDDIELGDAQLLARVLSAIDSEKGIRIDPPPAGQLYYGAFLPDPELLDRDARVDHPWELSLAEKDGKLSGRLLLVDSVWKEGRSKPELQIAQLPVAQPQDLRKELDAEAERTKKADRMAKPAAILVFAPATLKYGQLRKFLAPAIPTHKMIHVYVDVPQPPIHKADR